MQSAEDGLTSNESDVLSLDDSWHRSILLQPEVRSRLVVVGQVLLENTTQMSLSQHDHMVEAFPPDRPDDSLAVSVLPRGSRCCDDLFDAKGGYRICDPVAIDAVSVLNHKPRCVFKQKCLGQL
jgi:hypothetical protein